MNWKGCERKQLRPNSEVEVHESISTRMLEMGLSASGVCFFLIWSTVADIYWNTFKN